MFNTNIRLMTIRVCCECGRFSRATFYRLAKSDPKFPSVIKLGASTRVRRDDWRAYIESLGKQPSGAT